MGERLRACREAHRPHRPPLRLSLQALQIHFWGAHAKYTEFETAVLAALAAEGSGACLCAKGGGATEEGRERARALGRAGGGGLAAHHAPCLAAVGSGGGDPKRGRHRSTRSSC